jgi:hypothetical protein
VSRHFWIQLRALRQGSYVKEIGNNAKGLVGDPKPWRTLKREFPEKCKKG